MLILTSFQGIFNIKYILIPDWWISIYPLSYYFIGCYLKEYKVNINKHLNILLFIIVLIVSSLINIYFSKGNYFKFGVYNDRGSIFNVLTSVLLFIFIINLNLNRTSNKIRRIVAKISELSLGMYLSTSIVDDFLYFHYFKDINFFSIKGYFEIVPLVLILSISLSIILNIIYKLIDKLIVKKVTKAFIK